MTFHFTKMQGLGNDFVVIDAVSQKFNPNSGIIKAISHRRYGVGCDQVLIVAPATRADVDFDYRIYNADGSEVAQCGNGARCLARFIRDRGLSDKAEIAVATSRSNMRLRLNDDQTVSVTMGIPHFQPDQIPFQTDQHQAPYELAVAGLQFHIYVANIGNPHAVMLVQDIHHAPVADLGPQIESHPKFPERVNVGFMQIINQQHIALRVYERGAGETEACGSGACAAVAIGVQQKLLSGNIRVDLPGGSLYIHWPAADMPMQMTGPAENVFEGVWLQ